MKIVSHVLDAVAKWRSARLGPVPVVVFTIVAGFAPPARIIPRDLLLVIGGVVALPIGRLLRQIRSHLMTPKPDTLGPLGPRRLPHCGTPPEGAPPVFPPQSSVHTR